VVSQIQVPHKLGKAEAKRRMKARIGDLGSHIPGGAAQVRSSWTDEDTMALEVEAMGQKVSATMKVEDNAIQVALTLPMMLSFASGAIEAAVRSKGSDLLLGGPTDKA
jgi:hypothetical protein